MKTKLKPFLFRIVYVPEEYLIDEDDESCSTPDCGDLDFGTKIGGLGQQTPTETDNDTDDNLDHACLSDIQEQLEE